MGKKLVAYFSASGVTRKAAEMVAEAAGLICMKLSLKCITQRLI